ncbi:DUF2189 domain-containing protein [Thiorhodococcus minor]|uniref:DUF2189 domain-containing protein n=1 Tax=Thiorhodococcus minor TaxID=57489 RepID=A0A6M0JXG1_9GAMM|nr:DUF2189 domain-containing protein [Thiorhodococcus minor]NEV62236.1 DUF2189 domain-containing protein [Thiorhodococcus minor]
MQQTATAGRIDPADVLPVGTIQLEHPWTWLRKGWDDILAAPGFSLTYGFGIALLSVTMTALMIFGKMTFIVPFLIAGFFLMAPLMAIGLYQMSAHLERGESLERCQALEAFKRNHGQLGIFTGILFVILQAWLLTSVVLVVLLFNDPFPTFERFVPVVFLSGEHNLVLLAVTLVGAAFAAFVFCISAITVPLLTDRHVDAVTAMRTSMRAVIANARPMALWAALIVFIVGAGLVTFYVGLFLAIPLVGHASWHAYRDLVPRA